MSTLSHSLVTKMTMTKKPLSLTEGSSVFKKICTCNLFNAGSAPGREPGMRRQEAGVGAFGGLLRQLSRPETAQSHHAGWTWPRHHSESSP